MVEYKFTSKEVDIKDTNSKIRKGWVEFVFRPTQFDIYYSRSPKQGFYGTKWRKGKYATIQIQYNDVKQKITVNNRYRLQVIFHNVKDYEKIKKKTMKFFT